MALIATWREEGRLPVATIQWMLQACFGLELSVGEIISLLHAVAAQGRKQVAAIRETLHTRPVVQGDETTWRENGRNGYLWSFSTPTECYIEYRYSRSGQAVPDILGVAPDTTLVCDFYSAYNRHQGPIQRCWAHLLRAIHELKARYPQDEALQAWGQAVHALYLEACACRERYREEHWLERFRAAQRLERELMRLCKPYLKQEVPQRVLCQRCQRFLKQLFRFVVDLRVPADNNAAERAIRPLAVARKISGGTRSPQGSQTKSILASLFGTWRLQGLNALVACTRLLASPQI
jgi:hypothetical protein